MIAIIISANTEWAVVSAHFAVQQFETTPFGQHFRLQENGEELGFFYGGWGKIDAAASVQYIIDTYKPQLVINIGTCGGFAGQVGAGEVIIAEKTIVYDIYERMFDAEQAIQDYTTDIDLSWLRDKSDERVKRTTLISADQDIDPKEVRMLQARYHAVAADWESGALAHVCKRNYVPVLIARSVSDVVSESEGEAYQSPEVFVTRTEKIMDHLLAFLPTWISMYRAYLV